MARAIKPNPGVADERVTPIVWQGDSKEGTRFDQGAELKGYSGDTVQAEGPG